MGNQKMEMHTFYIFCGSWDKVVDVQVQVK